MSSEIFSNIYEVNIMWIFSITVNSKFILLVCYKIVLRCYTWNKTNNFRLLLPSSWISQILKFNILLKASCCLLDCSVNYVNPLHLHTIWFAGIWKTDAQIYCCISESWTISLKSLFCSFFLAFLCDLKLARESQ